MNTIGGFFKKYATLISLIVLVGVVTSIAPSFLELKNILNVFKQISINGLIAFGMTFVILLGGIDLSVGSVLGLTGIIMGWLIANGVSDIVAILIALVLGTVLGMINGMLISRVRLQPFIATLSTMTMFRGLTMIISNGIPYMGLTKNSPILDGFSQGSVIGIPIPVIITLIVLGILFVVLQMTPFGKWIYAIGGNEEVARLSSVPVVKVKTAVYAISGLLCALSGVILTSRLSSAQPTAGESFEMDAIAAVVIGGTSMSGGKGRILGTFLGIIIIGVLNNALNILGVSAFYQLFVKGVVILLAVIFDRRSNA